MPVLGLGADVIAGFPGETEADHRGNAALVERLPFTYLHVFPYSPRPGTAARGCATSLAPLVAERGRPSCASLATTKSGGLCARSGRAGWPTHRRSGRGRAGGDDRRLSYGVAHRVDSHEAIAVAVALEFDGGRLRAPVEGGRDASSIDRYLVLYQ